MHVLKVRDGHGKLRTGDAVIPLAAGYEYLDVLVGIRRVLDAREDVTGAQGTLRSIGHGFTEKGGNYEGL